MSRPSKFSAPAYSQRRDAARSRVNNYKVAAQPAPIGMQDPAAMRQPQRTELEVFFSRDKPFEQRVAWPILKSTDMAWLIQTPPGELWVPIYRWARMLPGRGASANERQLDATLCSLREITSTHRDARVEVRRAGKGSSDLSVTVSFMVAVHCPKSCQVISELKRTSIVPASQVQAHGDKWSVPRWLAVQKLKPGEAFLTRAVWPGMQAMQDQLQAAFDAAMAGEVAANAATLKAAQEAAERRAQNDRIAAHAKSVRQALVAEEGELALAFARKKLKLTDLVGLGCRLSGWPQWLPGEPVDKWLEAALVSIIAAVRDHPEYSAWRAKNIHRQGALLKPPKPKAARPRQPDRVINNCQVDWCEWLGPTKSQRRVDHRDEGCTVKVFGQKYEIELPGGRVVVKMTGPNLKITELTRSETID
ncbi:hypothetical protein [Roseateles albus]|uniref:Uncharacterized protein n=1 Tax=Roseateles albus TaxID=2987525 RepID=A0ABT5KI32_9BURK|nr:hypothetical protein [Roseateles albus]MDC8773526.1 hypothetical protein [Roseateles albus]